MLKISNLRKSFANQIAVNDLSLSIAKGEIVGLLGPNGAGKSTTMRLILGYLFPDSGNIELDDVSVFEQSITTQRRMGYLAENNPLYSELTVSEMLASSGMLRRLSASEYKTGLDLVVPATGISEVFNRPIRELSKGYRQRLGIALALLHQPDLLILDEPTEGLDPNQRREIRLLLKKLGKDRTVIMSTHVMQEVVAVCDRIIIISRGQLVADGTQQELLATHAGVSPIEVELEGESVLTTLKKQKYIKIIQSQQVSRQRTIARLISLDKKPIQPRLTELAYQSSWIIWSLRSIGEDLEHLFQQLTTNH